MYSIIGAGSSYTVASAGATYSVRTGGTGGSRARQAQRHQSERRQMSGTESCGRSGDARSPSQWRLSIVRIAGMHEDVSHVSAWRAIAIKKHVDSWVSERKGDQTRVTLAPNAFQPDNFPTSCDILQCAHVPSCSSSLICIQDRSCCNLISAHRLSDVPSARSSVHRCRCHHDLRVWCKCWHRDCHVCGEVHRLPSLPLPDSGSTAYPSTS